MPLTPIRSANRLSINGAPNQARRPEQSWRFARSHNPGVLPLLLLIAVLTILTPDADAQTQIHNQNRGTSVSDSFYEYSGVNWGMNFGNANSGSGSRSFGGFNFGAPAIPQFGGYNPNSAARFGFAQKGNPGFHFGLTMASGSNRSLVSSGTSTTSLNGYPSSIFSGSMRPFVTGYTPVVGNNSGYYPGYGYGYPGYGVPYRYPTGYRVSVKRNHGPSFSQQLRDSGHVGAHDHGHQHGPIRSEGRNHYYIQPIYSPYCGLPYSYYPGCGYPGSYYPGYGYPYGGYGGYGGYGYSGYGYGITPIVGAGVLADPDRATYASVPASLIPGATAAGIVEAQAAAVQQWEEHDASAEATTAKQRDPLGNVIAASSEESDSSTAAKSAPSLSKIRKRQKEEARLERDLRHAAIERLIDASRQAYDNGEVVEAISQAKTALERCTDEDDQLKEKILRGIQKMQKEKANQP